MIAHDPLHGSRRAELPHRALASSSDDHALLGIGVTDADVGQVPRGPAEPQLYFLQLRPPSLPDRLPEHDELPPSSSCRTHV